MRWRVVWAFFDVILTFWPIRWLSKLDLPTFGRPTMAIVPQRNSVGATDATADAGLALSLGAGADAGPDAGDGVTETGLTFFLSTT